VVHKSESHTCSEGPPTYAVKICLRREETKDLMKELRNTIGALERAIPALRGSSISYKP